MRLINADELIEILENSTQSVKDIHDAMINAGLVVALCELKRAPTIEAEPVRHGRWAEGDCGYDVCSKCRYEWDTTEYDESNYCPQCGAKMDLEE